MHRTLTLALLATTTLLAGCETAYYSRHGEGRLRQARHPREPRRVDAQVNQLVTELNRAIAEANRFIADLEKNGG
jgi:hypothetical protein